MFELIRICTLLGSMLSGTYVDVNMYTEEEINYCLDLMNGEYLTCSCDCELI